MYDTKTDTMRPLHSLPPGTEILVWAVVVRQPPEDDTVEVAITSDVAPTVVGWLPGASWAEASD